MFYPSTRVLIINTDQLISLNSTFTITSHHLISYLSLSANSSIILSQWQQEVCHHQDKRCKRTFCKGLGVQRRGEVFIDRMLPFSFHSASKIFPAVADAVQWILPIKKITCTLHYLDDYIMGTDSIDKVFMQRGILTSTFEFLGVPIEHSKLKGSSSCLTYLGIEVDTESL